MIKVNSIGESLEDYARRNGMTVRDAYQSWHAHGQSCAEAWRHPCRLPESEACSVRGGRAFAMYPRLLR